MLRSTRRVQQYRDIEVSRRPIVTFITYFGRVGETGDKSRQLTHGATMFLPRRMVRLRRCAAALQKLHPGLVQQEGSRLVVVGP